MEKLLVAVDGSAPSRRAVEFVVARATPASQIHLVNVQEPQPAEVVMESGISPQDWQVEYQTVGREAMTAACKVLDDAHLQYTTAVAVGDIADQIVAHARELGITQIVMGTRGLSVLAGIVMGSVAARVVRAASCPVTLVK